MPASYILFVTHTSPSPHHYIAYIVMVKVLLNNVVIAETDKFEVVENNKYFPPESLKKDYFNDSATQCVGFSFPF